ncbi:hypothetical protein DL546_006455 [Coniochaeta pulveracea]|uniref:Uncharacterized protein n=1 Tax=Coniochaeta pulveracea TaxID=177199 RepID=A0A420YAR4_9PEZI|nr:hypothetical protein DL546_006455 [Coniochaeta pulveracea]
MLPTDETTSPKAAGGMTLRIDSPTTTTPPYNDDSNSPRLISSTKEKRWFHRTQYPGSLLFNIATFILPALYSTLSKLWISELDSSLVVTTDAFTYMNTIAEAFNEGLPRAAWVIIGDKASRSLASRLQLSHTLILCQTMTGVLLAIIFTAAADEFAGKFVPEEVRSRSLAYVRISAWTVMGGMVETAVGSVSRALDRTDVPTVIATVKVVANIVLDLLFLSRFRVVRKGKGEVGVEMQAGLQLCCQMVAAGVGLGYFWWRESWKVWKGGGRRSTRTGTGIDGDGMGMDHDDDDDLEDDTVNLRPSWDAFMVLLRPGIFTFAESGIRNALYLWLVTTIVALGSIYATAWGIFNTIRWGLVMVPVTALEQTSLQFIGHGWGAWRKDVGIHVLRPRPATWREVLIMVRPALYSLALALAFEVPIAIFLSIFGARPFALYISGSEAVADVTAYMWRTIDWCYIFYAMSTQLATVLLATRPKWYLAQSVASNIFYVLPWAVVCQVKDLSQGNAWTWHSLVFGGSLVFSFVIILVFDVTWVWSLRTGRAKLDVFRE